MLNKRVSPGTENVPYAVALGEAARIAKLELHEYIVSMLALKLKFLQLLENALSEKVSLELLC